MQRHYYFLTLLILFISCENKIKNTDNKLTQSELNKIFNNQTPTNVANQNSITIPSNFINNRSYDVEESIRKLQTDNQKLYESQMKEIEIMKQGLNSFNSIDYHKNNIDNRVNEIMADAKRIRDEVNNIGGFKPYSTPYIPDPISLPNSTGYSNDYINPNANPAKVDVSGYTRSDGTYVESYIRTAPNDRIDDNLRY